MKTFDEKLDGIIDFIMSYDFLSMHEDGSEFLRSKAKQQIKALIAEGINKTKSVEKDELMIVDNIRQYFGLESSRNDLEGEKKKEEK